MGVNTAEVAMIATAARTLKDGEICFLGLGLGTRAALLARRTHAPNLRLVYESGCLGAKPSVVPKSIGDPSLLETADGRCGLPVTLNYLLMGGRVDVGIVGSTQVDRYGNINTSVIGAEYAHPQVRLAGPGALPEIVFACRRVCVLVHQSRRTLVEKVDFITGNIFARAEREPGRAGEKGLNSSVVITDQGVYSLDPEARELMLTAVYAGVDVDQAVSTVGWQVKVSDQLSVVPEVTGAESALMWSMG